ncbi:DMT family transporter [Sphingobacterium corticibacter]|uniref:EamA family transporter n=1 Tax=Sphingobacterium corticibacter TaxID=2171749 RepID=A0A2T8HHF4_9SPHI|nr:EamA family transporter [Sphingobacterium corticibacter]PVH24752.1 EamA family transporter [Sphingobacterium corticibacter]
MTKSGASRNVLILHFTVLIWGFTGVLGELISVSALHLVWYRVLIAAISLFIYLLWCKQPLKVSRSQLLQFLGVGFIVGLHWVLFFHSIKISTVSVTLVSLSSVTLFTAVLEPLINRKRMEVSDVLIGLLIIFGIYLIFKFEFQYFWGIVFGLLAAICASFFGIFNARMVKTADAKIISFYEMVGAVIGVSILLGVSGGFDAQMLLHQSDVIYLLVLGIVCTAVAYVLAVSVMREVSAFTVALATNLEPVYGIMLALLLFGQKEAMSTGFYAGAVLVLMAVFMYPYLKNRWIGRRLSVR